MGELSCQAIDLVLGEEFNYIVMEYIKGYDLNSDEVKKVNQKDKHNIFLKIIEAFSILHSHDLVHGDIHNSNILIVKKNDHNSKFSIKVIDYGFSSSPSAINTNHGGLTYFIPPERVQQNFIKKNGISKYVPGAESDIYQLGLIGFYLYENYLPFRGETWHILAKNIKSGSAKKMKNCELNYIRNVITSMLNKNPSDRPLLEKVYRLLKERLEGN